MKNNKTYKFFKISLLIVFMLCAALLVVSCANEHTHSYKRNITKKPTCTEKGEITFVCECGDFYTEETGFDRHIMQYVFDEEGHSYVCKNCDYVEKTEEHYLYVVEDKLLYATCVKEGFATYSCECGYETTEILPLLDHALSYVVADGTHYQKCANCDYQTEAVEHNFKFLKRHTPATCQAEGEDIYACECSKTKTTPLEVIDHNYSKIQTDENQHWTVCAMCNAEDPQGERVNHVMAETVLKEPDCTNSGGRKFVCDCGYFTAETIPALGHNLDKSKISDSKLPNENSHYYKCLRCNEDIPEAHDLKTEGVICPDNYTAAPTCYKEGHYDGICTVCNKQVHRSIPRTDDHSFADEWTTSGTYHWHICTNGNGTITCDAKGSYEQHSNEVLTDAPTCTEGGRIYDKCSVCGLEQLRKNLPAAGHKFAEEVITPATCTENGSKRVTCENCDYSEVVEIAATKHDWKAFKGDEQGHWDVCSVCGTEKDHNLQSQKAAHTWNTTVEKEATCTENGKTVKTCKYCGFTQEIVTTKNHNYVTNPASYVDPTCTEYGHHTATCSMCNNTITVTDEWYLDHEIFYVKAKPATDTQDGNNNYWQCVNCNKYFKTSNCEIELTEDEVFIRAPKVTEVATFAELQEIAEQLAANSSEDVLVTKDYYKLTLTVYDVTADGSVKLWDNEDDSTLTVSFPDDVDTTFETGYTVTLKTTLYIEKDGSDVIYDFAEIVVLEVDNGNDNEYNLFIERVYADSIDEQDYEYISAFTEYEGGWYYNDIKYFNVLKPSKNNTLTVKIYNYQYNSNIKLEKVFVNGVATTVPNGILTITVTGDVHIRLILNDNPSASVTVNKLDTSSQDEHAMDEYVTYQYKGQYNDNGRILQNSHLTFTVNEANIVQIVLTYQDYNVNNEEYNVFKNTVKAGMDKDSAIVQTQVRSEKNSLKVILTFDASEGYVYLDYFANVCQARLTEITVEYVTANNFAPWQW